MKKESLPYRTKIVSETYNFCRFQHVSELQTGKALILTLSFSVVNKLVRDDCNWVLHQVIYGLYLFYSECIFPTCLALNDYFLQGRGGEGGYSGLQLPIAKMSTENIFLLLLNPPSNNAELQKIIAKHMHDCYEIRKNVNKS